MYKPRITVLTGLAVGLSLYCVGIADDRETALAPDEPGALWVITPEQTDYAPKLAAPPSASLAGSLTILSADEQEPAVAAAAPSLELLSGSDAESVWDFDSEVDRLRTARSDSPQDDLQQRFTKIVTQPSSPSDLAEEPPGDLPLWNLDDEPVARIPVLEAKTSILPEPELAVFTGHILAEPEADLVSVFDIAQPQPTHGDAPGASLGGPVGSDTVGGDPDAGDPPAGELAIPLVEPLDLQSIRLAALQSDRQISIVRFQQEEAATGIDIAEARFDPIFGAALFGGERDSQVRNIIQSFGANSTVQQSYFLRPYEENQFFLRKRTYVGGQATIGFTSDYLSLDPADQFVFFNPGWDSRLRFQYQQSLLRGFGKAVNTAPIVIAARRADQSAFTFQARVQQLLRDVELAYWDWELAFAIQQLLEEDEDRARGLWNREQESLRIGTSTVASEAQARERYHQAQIALIAGMSLTTIGELRLRQVAGLPPVEGFAFVPADSAETERHVDDLHVAICNSVRRPEILAQQAAVAAANAQALIAENGLKPDLSVTLDYSMLGLEERFDDSLSTLGNFEYNEWTAGIRYTQPLYWRAERAAFRRAQWTIARQQATLDQVQHVISHEVANAYEQVRATAAQLQVFDDRTQAAKMEVDARTELYNNRQGPLDLLIDAQDRYLAARTEYLVALATHQKAITLLNYASGMILEDQILIDDPALLGVPGIGCPIASEPVADGEPVPQDDEADNAIPEN